MGLFSLGRSKKDKPEDDKASRTPEEGTELEEKGAESASPEAAAKMTDDAASEKKAEDKTAAESDSTPAEGKDRIHADIVEQIKTVFDPEIPVNIYELGLIYEINIEDNGAAEVIMTLTSPNCPAAESMPAEVDQKVQSVEGVTDSKVHIVWDPAWTPDMMTEEAKLELNMF